ncbi:MAG: hypothetical protein IM631_12110 [Cytophagales bacterium]|nr:hypothetical protein [Cytophagales bacterium]MCA6372114.1 hypothetical protein [Cytophagales bacterium]MCA6382258.1 hypothetical protein [Cytophagales bacterium]
MRALLKNSTRYGLALLLAIILQSCLAGGTYYCPSYGDGKKFNHKGARAQAAYIKKHRKDNRR